MANAAKQAMTVEEFFQWQLAKEDRYELVDGFPVKMMTGASNFHDRIATNIIAALGNQLKGGPCWVASPDSATRTRIRGIRRPDVTVTGAPPRPDAYEAGDPRLVVEVLSPSNAGIAWQRKLDEYWRLQGLAYVLLIDSLSVRANFYTRRATEWELTEVDAIDAVLDMPGIGCKLAMRDAYEGLTFETPD